MGDQQINGTVPALRRWENSWIVERRATGKAVLETSNADLVKNINRAAYNVWSVGVWLAEVNRRIKAAA